METKVNYTLVGAFVLVFGSILLLIAMWLSFGFQKQSYTTYVAYFDGSVSGLNLNATVRFNGVPVGYVSAIDLVPKKPKTVLLHLDISSKVRITQDTKAYLQSQGLTGLPYVELQGGTDSSLPLLPPKGKKYGRIQTAPTFNLTQISDSIRDLLSPENIKNFSATLANLSKTSQEFPQLVTNFNKTLKSWQTMSDSVTGAGKDVSLTMQDGRVALQGLADQAMPETVLALGDLRQLLVSLEQLNLLLQQDPAVLIRGKKPLPPGPGEKD